MKKEASFYVLVIMVFVLCLITIIYNTDLDYDKIKGLITGSDKCTLSSEKYKVDNNKRIISNVDTNDTDYIIKNNLKSNCEDILVNGESVILDNEYDYTVVRGKTISSGNISIKYILAGASLVLLFTIIFIIIKK